MKTIFPRLVCLLGLVAFSTMISGCGNKGPLVPPKVAQSVGSQMAVGAMEQSLC